MRAFNRSYAGNRYVLVFRVLAKVLSLFATSHNACRRSVHDRVEPIARSPRADDMNIGSLEDLEPSKLSILAHSNRCVTQQNQWATPAPGYCVPGPRGLRWEDDEKTALPRSAGGRHKKTRETDGRPRECRHAAQRKVRDRLLVEAPVSRSKAHRQRNVGPRPKPR